MIPAEVLARVPGCEDGTAPLHAVLLPGGEGRNDVLRIETSQGRFVWRRRLGEVDRPGARAQTELLAHRVAAAAGLAPAVLAAAEDASWLLMEYVNARPWSEAELERDDGIEQLGHKLAQLHALQAPPELPEADAPQMARGYLQMLSRRDARGAEAARPVLERIEALGEALAASHPRRALVHGDLTTSNVLGRPPVLVDWEYAQAADPSWDCACLLNYYPRLQTQRERLAQSMGQGDAASRERLELQQERFALLHRLWDRAYSTLS